MKIRPLIILGSLVAAGVFGSACGRLSSEAREIVGNYIIPEVSQTEPVMELNSDATCCVRAIKPGVITYTVRGVWNVENDSLVMTLDALTLSVEGDSSLVGEIPSHFSSKLLEHNDLSMQLERDGVVYIYKRI